MYDCKSYKLATHQFAKCRVCVCRKDARVTWVYLYSYSTHVCGIYLDEVNDTWYVYCTGTYSQTTRRHIGWFARELRYAYAPCEIDYFDFKAIYEDSLKVGVYVQERLCKPEEVGAAIRLAAHYSASCSPIR